MTTPPAFPLFPLLPIELRLRVYALSLSYPRTIHIRTSDHPSNISHLPSPHPSLAALNLPYSDISWTTRTPPPALLSVSRETREIALSNYSLKFALLPAGQEIIYLNPELDTVFAHLQKWPIMLRLLLWDLRAFDVVGMGRGLRRLVVSKDVWRAWFSPELNVVGRNRVEMLAGLEEVAVVLGKINWEDEDMGRSEGDEGSLVVPGRDSEVVRWEQDVLEGWSAAKDAGLGDEVKLRMLAWVREGE